MNLSFRRACLLGFLAALTALISVSATAAPLFKNKESIPTDAIVLFNGNDLSQWMNANTMGLPAWKVVDGYCTPSGSDIATRQNFSDVQLHVEFWLPYMPNAHGQGRANSGVFLMGYSYEIQVLDSYGLVPQNNDCGSMYSQVPPSVNAARPPRTWQTYDIIFHAPKFDEHKKKIANARVTVFWNGVMVHNNDEFIHKTPGGGLEPTHPGPIRLQNHGNAVRYRNIWVRPL